VSKFVLTDVTYLQDGVDLTGLTNTIGLTVEADELDATTFGGDGWRERLGGLKSGTVEASGFIDLATVDALLFNGAGGTAVISVSPTGVDGSDGYLMAATRFGYQHTANIGELAAWTGTASSRDQVGVVKGTVLHPVTARNSSGSGVGRQLGAVGADERLSGVLHVLAVSGDLDVIVQSDDNDDFTSPVTRLTFATASAVGGQLTQLSGPVADDWFRVGFTLSGGGSATFAVTVGISS
jgi:hypothetical protein